MLVTRVERGAHTVNQPPDRPSPSPSSDPHEPDEHHHLTFAEVLAKHAAAQIAAARDADEASRVAEETEVEIVVEEEATSFTVSWRYESHVIGWREPEE